MLLLLVEIVDCEDNMWHSKERISHLFHIIKN